MSRLKGKCVKPKLIAELPYPVAAHLLAEPFVLANKNNVHSAADGTHPGSRIADEKRSRELVLDELVAEAQALNMGY